MSSLPNIATDAAVLNANRILSPDTPHQAEGAYRMLRTRLMQKMRSNGWRTLGVTSIGPNEGKTFTAINLAVSIAAEVGQEVLLVDLDLRRPSVHRYLGIDPSEFASVGQYLDGTSEKLGEMLVCPGIDRMGCLLTGVPLDQPSDLLASPRGKQLFDDLRRELPPETVIVIDLPPLLTVDDALAVAPMIDALLFVVAEGETKRDELTDARQLLEEFNLVGTLLNKSIDTDSRKNYYY
jgi:capsular exopolysaccharide synthesis family protein